MPVTVKGKLMNLEEIEHEKMHIKWPNGREYKVKFAYIRAFETCRLDPKRFYVIDLSRSLMQGLPARALPYLFKSTGQLVKK